MVTFASRDSVIEGVKIPFMGAIRRIALIFGSAGSLKTSENDAGLIDDKTASPRRDQGCRRFRLVRASSRDA
jgi:hypothetical protein